MGRKKTKFVINLPKSWDEISLKKYQDIVKLYEENDNKPSIQQIIALLSDKKVDEINQMPSLMIDEIMNNLLFLKDKVTDEISNEININNEIFFINYLEELKFGEFVDVQTVLKDDKNNYAMLLAILCRKEGEIYNDEYISKEVNKRVEMFEQQPISKIFPTIAFFLLLWKMSKSNMDIFSQNIKAEGNQFVTSIEDFLKTGAGKKHSTKSLKKKLKTLKQQLNNI